MSTESIEKGHICPNIFVSKTNNSFQIETCTYTSSIIAGLYELKSGHDTRPRVTSSNTDGTFK